MTITGCYWVSKYHLQWKQILISPLIIKMLVNKCPFYLKNYCIYNTTEKRMFLGATRTARVVDPHQEVSRSWFESRPAWSADCVLEWKRPHKVNADEYRVRCTAWRCLVAHFWEALVVWCGLSWCCRGNYVVRYWGNKEKIVMLGGSILVQLV